MLTKWLVINNENVTWELWKEPKNNIMIISMKKCN